LDILEKLGEVWLARGDLRDDILKSLDNVFNIGDARGHVSDSLDCGAVVRGGLGGIDEGLHVSNHLDKVHALTILDDGLSGLNNLREVTGAVLKVSDLAKLAISLGSLDVRGDFLDILDELGKVWFTRFGLGDDVFDIGNHVLDIVDASLDVFGIDLVGHLAILFSIGNVSCDLLGVSQDLGEIRRARTGLGDNVFTGGIKVL